MHRYRQIEYRTQRSIEVIKCIPPGYRRGEARGEKRQPKTREEMQRANMQQAARRLARKINANFGPGDYHLILTYRLGIGKKEAQKCLTHFLTALRKLYRKSAEELKYIAVTEYQNKRIHHHLIINNTSLEGRTVPGAVRALWKENGGVKFIPLYDSGEYSELASYLIKETEKTFREKDSPVKQRYSCSRNLVTPVPEIRDKEVRTAWKEHPRPRPGYYLKPESLYNGRDRMGYRYQRYILIRLSPDGTEWEEGWQYEEFWPD